MGELQAILKMKARTVLRKKTVRAGIILFFIFITFVVGMQSLQVLLLIRDCIFTPKEYPFSQTFNDIKILPVSSGGDVLFFQSEEEVTRVLPSIHPKRNISTLQNSLCNKKTIARYDNSFIAAEKSLREGKQSTSTIQKQKNSDENPADKKQNWIAQLHSNESRLNAASAGLVAVSSNSGKKARAKADSKKSNKAEDNRSIMHISKIMAQYNEELQEFYRRELKLNPNLQGYLEVRFTVTPKGNVESVSVVKSSLNSEKLEKCVKDKIMLIDDFGICDPKIGKCVYRQGYTFGSKER